MDIFLDANHKCVIIDMSHYHCFIHVQSSQMYSLWVKRVSDHNIDVKYLNQTFIKTMQRLHAAIIECVLENVHQYMYNSGWWWGYTKRSKNGWYTSFSQHILSVSNRCAQSELCILWILATFNSVYTNRGGISIYLQLHIYVHRNVKQ